jgi:hypothetical protein
MDQSLIHFSKWFWPWQDEQEEAWLEKLSLQGFHLKQPNIFSRYDFTKGQPQKYVYRLDYRDAFKKKDKENYLHLFAEAGWEYIGEMSGWQYFRKPANPDEEAEIFTDPDTKIQKYQRYLTNLGLLFSSNLVFLVLLLDYSKNWFIWLYYALMFGFLIFSGLIWVNTSKRIRELKKL